MPALPRTLHQIHCTPRFLLLVWCSSLGNCHSCAWSMQPAWSSHMNTCTHLSTACRAESHMKAAPRQPTPCATPGCGMRPGPTRSSAAAARAAAGGWQYGVCNPAQPRVGGQSAKASALRSQDCGGVSEHMQKRMCTPWQAAAQGRLSVRALGSGEHRLGGEPLPLPAAQCCAPSSWYQLPLAGRSAGSQVPHPPGLQVKGCRQLVPGAWEHEGWTVFLVPSPCLNPKPHPVEHPFPPLLPRNRPPVENTMPCPFSVSWHL